MICNIKLGKVPRLVELATGKSKRPTTCIILCPDLESAVSMQLRK